MPTCRIVSVLRYEDESQLVDQANATNYGLHGAIYSADPERAYSLARRIRSGSLAISGMAVDIEMPFGGFKQSSIGREGGVEGLADYLETKAIYMT